MLCYLRALLFKNSWYHYVFCNAGVKPCGDESSAARRAATFVYYCGTMRIACPQRAANSRSSVERLVTGSRSTRT